MFKKIALKRRDFALQFISKQDEILEIGPFNNPTFRRDLNEKVWSMDMFSKSELTQMHKNNPTREPDSIIDVDFVVKDLHFSRSIPRRFDLIAAHHVVEHIANLLLWLEECHALLRDDGRIFLSIPDKRFTFDFFRPVSLASQVLRSSKEKAEKPQLWQVVEHFYYHQKVDVNEIWNGNVPSVFRPRFSLKDAIIRAKEREDIYTDTHCWVFTPESFRMLISDLKESEFISFKLESLQDTQEGSNEFRAILRKV